MKRNIGILLSLILMMSIAIFTFSEQEAKDVIVSDIKSGIVGESSSIAMMFETDANSGVYELSDDILWPNEGYIFNETLSKCENGSKISFDKTTKSIVLQTNVTDKCYVYFDKVETSQTLSTFHDVCNDDSLACLIAKKSVTDETLYYHDEDLENGANDNNYRYAGSNPNNYVCLENDTGECNDGNLYRIIGVFHADNEANYQVKLIKNTSIGTNYWSGASDESATRNWKDSTLNTMVLNGSGEGNYLHDLKEKWENKIANHTWYVGGIAFDSGVKSSASTVFNNELGPNRKSTTYKAKIGLMYISDYSYASSKANWTMKLDSYSSGENWLYKGTSEWMITADLDYNNAFIIDDNGSVNQASINTIQYNFRPVFYLDSSVVVRSGSGTSLDPYIVF